MSASTTLDRAGQLLIHGTSGNDQIEVVHTNGGVRVVLDGTSGTYSDAKVKTITIDGQGGRDQILVDRFSLKQNVFFVDPAPTKSVGKKHRGGTAQKAIIAAAPPAKFPIGVWLQPTYTFDAWKARGVNTLVGYESVGGTVSMNAWISAAASRGLQMIRPPSSSAAKDLSDPLLLAYLQQDEPDGKAVLPSALTRIYSAWKASAPRIPVFLNLDGSRVLGWQGNVTSATYRSYTAAADYLGSDVYPVTGWNRPAQLDAPGKAVTQLAALSGGKPQFAFIEASDQELPWLPRSVPGPTIDQFRAEIWNAILQGAKGIIYFPQQIGYGFKYDNTASPIAAEMTLQNARIASIGAALESPTNPPGTAAIATAPFQTATRVFGGKRYYIVLNNSSRTLTAQPIRLTGSETATSATVDSELRTVPLAAGSLVDTFTPYAVHVYVVG